MSIALRGRQPRTENTQRPTPTELLGLEEEGGPLDLAGAEDDEEEEPTESLSFGDDDNEEGEESYDLSAFDEDDDSSEYGGFGEDEDEEEDIEGTPETQRASGARFAVGLRARRRARLLGVAALRKRRRARLFAFMALRNRKRARLLGLAAIRNKKRARLLGLAAPADRMTRANTAYIAQRIKPIVDAANPKVVAVDLSAGFDLEYTALKMLTDAARRQRERGMSVWLVGLNPAVRTVIERSPLGEMLGREGLHFNVEVAVANYLRRAA